jgi:hypothetical protein
MSTRHAVAGKTMEPRHRRAHRSERSRDAHGDQSVGEFEVRLYAPHDPTALCFARVESLAQAQSLSRRWQAARPGYRVEVASATTPLPVTSA